MYLAMNRFQVNQAREQEFVEIWKNRQSYLDQVPGFKSFQLLRGPEEDGVVLYASHSIWQDEDSFIAWTKSESFRKAHANAGKTPEGIYNGHPKLELFESVI